MLVLLASNNQHKLRELEDLLRGTGIEVVTPAGAGVSLEVEESGSTFAENATLKAEAFCAISGIPSLADDSGLVVDALDGEPGIFSARYGSPDANDEQRTLLVLERMAAIPDELRGARFVAAIAYARPGGATEVYEGCIEGRISRQPRGRNGFGYDPIFLVEGLDTTMAELTSDDKSQVSHRGRALRAALPALLAHRDEMESRSASM